jgi:hypothetical protein
MGAVVSATNIETIQTPEQLAGIILRKVIQKALAAYPGSFVSDVVFWQSRVLMAVNDFLKIDQFIQLSTENKTTLIEELATDLFQDIQTLDNVRQVKRVDASMRGIETHNQKTKGIVQRVEITSSRETKDGYEEIHSTERSMNSLQFPPRSFRSTGTALIFTAVAEKYQIGFEKENQQANNAICEEIKRARSEYVRAAEAQQAASPAQIVKSPSFWKRLTSKKSPEPMEPSLVSKVDVFLAAEAHFRNNKLPPKVAISQWRRKVQEDRIKQHFHDAKEAQGIRAATPLIAPLIKDAYVAASAPPAVPESSEPSSSATPSMPGPSSSR